MAVVKKIDFHNNTDIERTNIPLEARNVLKILNSLEDFTISIRKKIIEEIRSTSKLIHIKLDSLD